MYVEKSNNNLLSAPPSPVPDTKVKFSVIRSLNLADPASNNVENSVKSFIKLKKKIGLVDRKETLYHNRNHYVHPIKLRLPAAVREMSPRSSPERTERAAEIGSTYT